MLCMEVRLSKRRTKLSIISTKINLKALIQSKTNITSRVLLCQHKIDESNFEEKSAKDARS